MVTLDGALLVKLGAQHPQPENQHGKWKENSNAKGDTPNSMKMILPGD
jgi:hypothetical protein